MDFQVSSFAIIFMFLIIFSTSFGQEKQQYASIGDNIGANKSIIIGVTVVSSGGNFELGFFTPANTSNYYIGIWYKTISPQTVIWVANREQHLAFPEMDNAEFKIMNGNLVLLNGTRHVIWSTNVNSTKPDSVIAVLGNDGNLGLKDGSNSTSSVLWQSFDHLSNSFVPNSKISYNKHTKVMQSITSWRSLDDPGIGPYSIEIDPIVGQFRAMWNRTEEYWSSGPWTGDTFTNLPYTKPNTTTFNYRFINDDNETSFTYALHSPLLVSRFVIDITGELKQFTWIDSSKQWNVFFLQPSKPCDVYAYCGAFGTCDPSSSNSLCSCLPGFVPKLAKDWGLNIFSQGCVRKTNLSCGNPRAASNDRFWKTSLVTLPKYYETVRVSREAECESSCFNNCSCAAYAYNGSECLTWRGELLNLQQLSQDDARGRNLQIKLAASDYPSEQATKQKKSSTRLKAIIPATISVIILLVGCITYIYYRRRIAKRQVQRDHLAQWQSSEYPINDLTNDEENSIDVPSFSWESILAATDGFSWANMLGRGGFGPVYKGKFPGGREIAVKRLSTESGQGIEEFKNEVLLIARLQHRNLVRLLGYCIKGNEKILLYEYLSNKSLDTFIFENRTLLDWQKRFDIILGVARGMSYLHHDSRLRIIHRDLKTSNILLDEGMNPKISDFGLARIVQGNTTQVNTRKVVGTYGYMAPEYALDGLFSTKSDVFSFGVVILEIISGRRNTAIYKEEGTNVLGHAWSLWTEDKAIDLVDKSLLETCNVDEAIKCINIGLLCVQENSSDRPNMSNVILMLGGESMTLPRPNQPAFVTRETGSSTSTTSSSKNALTITMEQGR